jgi:hypothetical protein
VPFEADYTCTPQLVTEPLIIAAMPLEAGHEKLIWSFPQAKAGAGFVFDLFWECCLSGSLDQAGRRFQPKWTWNQQSRPN